MDGSSKVHVCELQEVTNLTFVETCRSAKTAKINTLENFWLFGNTDIRQVVRVGRKTVKFPATKY